MQHFKPSVVSDVFNDAMGEVAYVSQIQVVLDFASSLAQEVLGSALGELLRRSVFGYRFVPRFFIPYWELLPQEDLARRARITRQIVKASELQTQTERFLALPMDHTGEPQLRVLLLSHQDRDRLILKVNHMAADAAGTKETIYALAEIYTRFLSGEAVSEPVEGSRGLWQVLKGSLPRRAPAMMVNYFKDIWGSFRFPDPLTIPSGRTRGVSPLFCLRTFSPDTMSAIARLREETGATINDVLLTGMVHGALPLDRRRTGQALRLMGTVDLRRFIPSGKAGTFTNLSSFFFPVAGRYGGEPFKETLVRVKDVMDGLKEHELGLGWIFGSVVLLGAYPFGIKRRVIRTIFNRLAEHNNMGLSLTNLGRLDHDRLAFGPIRPVAGTVMPPACIPPSFFLGVSGFEDTLTLSMGFYESAYDSETIETLLGNIEAVLLEAGSG